MARAKVKGGATTSKRSSKKNNAARKARGFQSRPAVSGFRPAPVSKAEPHQMVDGGVPQPAHSDLISRLFAGGSSSTAVTDGLEREGGASTALYTTPGAAAMPCLLPGRVGVMWEATMVACLLAVGASIWFRHFRNRLQGRICGTVPSFGFSPPVYC